MFILEELRNILYICDMLNYVFSFIYYIMFDVRMN